MLTRGLAVRALLAGVRRASEQPGTLIKRNSGHGTWSYRMPPPPPNRRAIFIAEGLGGICWWWILYHIWSEPDHIYGEWEYIHPDTWTDEELGVPPDDEGSLLTASS